MAECAKKTCKGKSRCAGINQRAKEVAFKDWQLSEEHDLDIALQDAVPKQCSLIQQFPIPISPR